MIKIGDTLPDAVMLTPSSDGPQEATPAGLFGGKKAVLVGVPGAFTPTCHGNHLPGYLEHLDALKAKGVDLVACVAMNDVFVIEQWAAASGTDGKITMLADGAGAFTKAVGLELDLSAFHMGVRSQRYAMVLDNNVVTHLAVEDTPKTADASGAKAILAAL